MIICAACLVFSLEAKAQSGGKGTYCFLNNTGSASVAALGGKNISVYGADLNFAESNPSLLNPQADNHLSINYTSFPGKINFGNFIYAKDFNTCGTFAVGTRYLNYGTFTATDETGKITGSFTAADYVTSLSWAKVFLEKISVGASLKTLFSHYERYTSIGAVLDLGITYISEKDFTASIVLKNLGSQIKPYYPGHYEPVAWEIQAGISKKLQHAPFRIHLTAHKLNNWNLLYTVPKEKHNLDPENKASDASQNFGNKFLRFLDNSSRHLIVGVDFFLLKSFYIAGGYNHQRRMELKIAEKGGFAGFSVGAGLTLQRFGIHFAHSGYHLAGSANYISFYLNINNLRTKKTVETKKI